MKVNEGSPEARSQAAEWLRPLQDHLSDGGLGHISEIFDGDPPHRPCGCIAQAWSVGEVLRAYVEDVKGIKPVRQPDARPAETHLAAKDAVQNAMPKTVRLASA